MNTYDWSKFDIYIYIKSAPETLFNKWTTAEGLESFFMNEVQFESKDGKKRTKIEYVKPGDKYKWEFIHSSIIHGIILDVEQNRKISFTFGDDPDASIVDVLFIKSNNRTLLHLSQKNIPTSDEAKVNIHLNCRGAWIHFLTVLKSVVEFNIDCRDKEPLTGGSLAAGFVPKEYEQ